MKEKSNEDYSNHFDFPHWHPVIQYHCLWNMDAIFRCAHYGSQQKLSHGFRRSSGGFRFGHYPIDGSSVSKHEIKK